MRRALMLLPAVAVVLSQAGCGNMYYQTRYIPASADSVYSPAEQLTWSGDKQVYELPANPPAIDELHRQRVECKTPGQKFKPPAMAGIQDTTRHPEVNEPALVGALDQDPRPGLPYPAQKAVPVAGSMAPEQRGAREPIGLVPVGGQQGGPYPFRGSGTGLNPATNLAAYRSDQVDWCVSHKDSLTPTP